MTAVVVLGGALLIGATLGLLGGGGTVLTVPLVRALLGLDTRHAIALSLPVVARNGQTTADMANGPVQRVSPFPATVALPEKLGSKNNHRCVSC